MPMLGFNFTLESSLEMLEADLYVVAQAVAEIAQGERTPEHVHLATWRARERLKRCCCVYDSALSAWEDHPANCGGRSMDGGEAAGWLILLVQDHLEATGKALDSCQFGDSRLGDDAWNSIITAEALLQRFKSDLAERMKVEAVLDEVARKLADALSDLVEGPVLQGRDWPLDQLARRVGFELPPGVGASRVADALNAAAGCGVVEALPQWNVLRVLGREPALSTATP